MKEKSSGAWPGSRLARLSDRFSQRAENTSSPERQNLELAAIIFRSERSIYFSTWLPSMTSPREFRRPFRLTVAPLESASPRSQVHSFPKLSSSRDSRDNPGTRRRPSVDPPSAARSPLGISKAGTAPRNRCPRRRRQSRSMIVGSGGKRESNAAGGLRNDEITAINFDVIANGEIIRYKRIRDLVTEPASYRASRGETRRNKIHRISIVKIRPVPPVSFSRANIRESIGPRHLCDLRVFIRTRNRSPLQARAEASHAFFA